MLFWRPRDTLYYTMSRKQLTRLLRRYRVHYSIGREFSIYTILGKIGMRFRSGPLEANLRLTEQEWKNFLIFLRTIKPCCSGARAIWVIAGYDFDDKECTYTVASERAQRQQQEIFEKQFGKPCGWVTRIDVVATLVVTVPESRQRKRTGLSYRIKLTKGDFRVTVPRDLFRKIKTLCLNYDRWRPKPKRAVRAAAPTRGSGSPGH